MHKLTILTLAFSIVFITSCKKDDDTVPADTAAVIDITAPAAGTIYTNGSTVSVDGTAIDNNVLSSTRLEIRNKNTNAVLYQTSTSTGNVTFYRFHWTWTVTGITTLTPATVRVISKDKYNYETSKDVDFNLDN